MRRVMLAAVSSGSGKTTITCGIIRALTNIGMRVKAFKSGPDYIDTMFHSKVMGIPSENLDCFFSDEKQLNKLLARGSQDIDIEIIEGAMGIYDGIGGLSLEGSAYDLAAKTKTSIILIMDVHGMGRTMISLIKGIMLEDTNHLIKGIILNRISEGYYNTIAPVLEQEIGKSIDVIGYIPKLKNIEIKCRHLGLVLPTEIEDLDEKVDIIGKQVEKTISITKMIDISEIAEDLREEKSEKILAENGLQPIQRVKLAVAKDEVFCFYYEENLRLLEEAGAELVYFSPLHDKILPTGISGILLGGGYPELRLELLESNESMRNSIKEAINKGMPSLAECGGFMYLHDYIQGDDGTDYKMVGLIKGKCYNTGKLCRFGYVNLEIGDYIAKGHEFHYYDSTANGCDATAKKPTTSGKTWQYGYISKDKIWGYPHIYYGSCKELPKDFVERMREYRSEK